MDGEFELKAAQNRFKNPSVDTALRQEDRGSWYMQAPSVSIAPSPTVLGWSPSPARAVNLKSTIVSSLLGRRSRMVYRSGPSRSIRYTRGVCSRSRTYGEAGPVHREKRSDSALANVVGCVCYGEEVHGSKCIAFSGTAVVCRKESGTRPPP